MRLLHHQLSILEGLYSYLSTASNVDVGRSGKQVRLMQLRPYKFTNKLLVWPWQYALKIKPWHFSDKLSNCVPRDKPAGGLAAPSQLKRLGNAVVDGFVYFAASDSGTSQLMLTTS